ncbi:MAG: hypothetical protein MOGMAGMI_02461 [Candidatus Omnitrophica bacterium]|nr:hypothetical protein [Candidatus Omnitrophota bacterium]
MSERVLTPEELHVLQHTLGIDQYGRGEMYRNYFWGQDDRCENMVACGYMRLVQNPTGDVLYVVTDAGKKAVLAQSPAPPKLTRSQARYQKYLDTGADYCMSFGEWLRSGEYRVAEVTG